MEYWIAVNSQPAGPYTLNQLRAMRLTPDTRVWHEGLTDWVEINTLPEWSLIYVEPRDAAPLTDTRPGNDDERPNAYLGWSIAATILCFTPTGVAAIIMSVMVNKRLNRGDIAGARKMSDRVQIMIILTITLGLLWMPFSMIFNSITSSF